LTQRAPDSLEGVVPQRQGAISSAENPN